MPQKLMVFLHGYGANHRDFLELASLFGHRFPDIGFILPNAPTRINMPSYAIGESGGMRDAAMQAFQWFPLGAMLDEGARDAQKLQDLQVGLVEVFPIVKNFLIDVAQLYGCKQEEMILFGFSQGAMVALDVALRLPIGAVIACAGALGFADDSRNHYTQKVRALLCHGEADDVVPCQGSKDAHQWLKAHGNEVDLHLSPHTAHHLDSDMVAKIQDFIAKI